MNYDEYYISQLVGIASRSPDSNSKYGALLVGAANTIISTGYNGFPRGLDPEVGWEKDKYSYFIHAETNAIYNAARSGVPTVGSTMYLIRPPCLECAKAIIQAGVVHIVCAEKHPVYHHTKMTPYNWRSKIEQAAFFLQEVGIQIRFLT